MGAGCVQTGLVTMIDLDEHVALAGVKNVVAGEEISRLQARMRGSFVFEKKQNSLQICSLVFADPVGEAAGKKRGGVDGHL